MFRIKTTGHMLHEKGYLFLFVIFSRTILITLTNPIFICKSLEVTEEKRVLNHYVLN
jgi:hypothetical protein